MLTVALKIQSTYRYIYVVAKLACLFNSVAARQLYVSTMILNALLRLKKYRVEYWSGRQYQADLLLMECFQVGLAAHYNLRGAGPSPGSPGQGEHQTPICSDHVWQLCILDRLGNQCYCLGEYSKNGLDISLKSEKSFQRSSEFRIQNGTAYSRIDFKKLT